MVLAPPVRPARWRFEYKADGVDIILQRIARWINPVDVPAMTLAIALLKLLCIAKMGKALAHGNESCHRFDQVLALQGVTPVNLIEIRTIIAVVMPLFLKQEFRTFT